MEPSEPILDLHCFSYCDRITLVPALSDLLTQCGGWILNRKTQSTSCTEFCFEIQLRFILDLYAALVAADLQLTRDAHALLTDLCTCHRYTTQSGSVSLLSSARIVSMRLRVSFQEEVTVQSLLMTATCLA